MASTPPPPPELDQRDLTAFDRAGTLVGEFEAALKSCGIDIAAKSGLADICLEVLDLELKRLGRSRIDPRVDVRPMWRKAAGLIEFMKLFLRAHAIQRAVSFVPHLQLLNQGMISQSEPVIANVAPHLVFDASNKLFELFFGLACVPISTDVTLDDPFHSDGKNPDILTTIRNRRWGFACKVLSGQSAISMFDHLKKGVEQIERSGADAGAVVFKLTNVVDHELTWPLMNAEEVARGSEPILGTRFNEKPVLDYLNSIHRLKHSELEQVNGRQEVEALVRGKRTMPGCITFLQTTTGIVSTRGPVPTTVAQLGIMEFDPVAQGDFEVIQCINEVLHSRL